MNLTTTEKYTIAVLGIQGKLSGLQRRERGLCLAASCVWDMIQANAVTADEKGKLMVFGPLPEPLSYCAPVYEMLAKKPRKPERVVLDYRNTLTGKRIKALTETIADNLIDKSVLVVEKQSSLRKAKLCHVDTTVIAQDIAAVKHIDKTAPQEQIMLAVLLLESKAAKKLLSKKELSCLKKAVKQVNSDFRRYIRHIKNMILAAEIAILVSIAAAASQAI